MNKIKKILKSNKTKNYAFILLLIVSFILVNVSASSEIIYKNESYSISSGATKSSGNVKASYDYTYLSYGNQAPYNTTETFKSYGSTSKKGTYTIQSKAQIKIGIKEEATSKKIGKNSMTYWKITDTAAPMTGQYSSLGWYGTLIYYSRTS